MQKKNLSGMWVVLVECELNVVFVLLQLTANSTHGDALVADGTEKEHLAVEV